MPTTMVLRDTTDAVTTGGVTTDIGGEIIYDLIPDTFGTTVSLPQVTTTPAVTERQWTSTSGGTAICWITGRIPAGGVTLTLTSLGTWWRESAMTANCGGRFKIYRWQPSGPTLTLLGTFDNAAEFAGVGAISNTVRETVTGDVTDTAFVENDRILLRLFIRDIGGMGTGAICEMGFNAASGVAGDSTLVLTPTMTFKSEGANGAGATMIAQARSMMRFIAARTFGRMN